MQRTNSFKLLWIAVKNSRHSMWASLKVLIAITIVLTILYYIVEKDANPEHYSFGKSLVWSFTRYIGDPGNFAGNGPITYTGRWIATILGIVKILIFAVPAGLIGSGFKSAIDAENRKMYLRKIGGKIQKSFYRRQDTNTFFRYVPRYIPLKDLQARKNLSEKDIIDAVDFNPGFRLRNISKLDTLVIENFPLNRSYGCCIDRKSPITIVSTSSVDECGVGNFAYYLALFGGFNYISKEIEQDVDDTVSYYIIEDTEVPQQRFTDYMTDIKNLTQGENKWCIFIISSERESDTQLHFISKANANTGMSTTVIHEEMMQNIYLNCRQELMKDFKISADLDEVYRPVGKRNIAVKIGGGKCLDTFTIRVSDNLLMYHPQYITIVYKIAQIMNQAILSTTIDERPEWKDKGYGFNDK